MGVLNAGPWWHVGEQEEAGVATVGGWGQDRGSQIFAGGEEERAVKSRPLGPQVRGASGMKR